MNTISVKGGLVLAALLVCALQTAALEGVAVIANEGVPLDSIKASALKDIYCGKTTYWDGGQNVVVVVLADKTDAALKEVSGMDSSQFKTFWQRMVFSGRGQLPKKAADAASLVSLVASTKGAVALVPADTELRA